MASQQDRFLERAERLGEKADAQREENQNNAEARKRAEAGGFLSQNRVSGRVFAMVVPFLIGVCLVGPVIPISLVTLGFDIPNLISLALRPNFLIGIAFAMACFVGFLKGYPKALSFGLCVIGALFRAIMTVQYSEQIQMIGLDGQIIAKDGWGFEPDGSGFERFPNAFSRP